MPVRLDPKHVRFKGLSPQKPQANRPNSFFLFFGRPNSFANPTQHVPHFSSGLMLSQVTIPLFSFLLPARLPLFHLPTTIHMANVEFLL